MNRREFLAWVSGAGLGGVAGCPAGPVSSPTATDANQTSPPTASPSPTQPSTAPSERTSSPTATEDSPTETSDSETVQRYVSLDDVDSVPGQYGVEMDVELVRSVITDDQTARLRITTTNTGSPRHISVGKDKCSLLNRSAGGSDSPEGLWLHDPEDTQYIDRKGDRWEADRAADEPRGYAAYACAKREYTAGESISNAYVLWDDYQVEGYMERRIYRWEEEVTVSETETETGTSGEQTFTWGFSLEVGVTASVDNYEPQ